MKILCALLILAVSSSPTFAACDVNVKSGTLTTFAQELYDHSGSMNQIVEGYQHGDYEDITEGMQIASLGDSMREVGTAISDSVGFVNLREGITGNGNQRLVRKSLSNSLAYTAESAAQVKGYLLKSSATINNQSAESEIAQVIPILDSVIHLGDSCKEEG